VGVVRIRKPFADVPQSCRAQQCVHDRVQKYVSVAVTDKMPMPLNHDTTQSQRSTVLQAMSILSQANAYLKRGWLDRR
jgi:hypothetical protein